MLRHRPEGRARPRKAAGAHRAERGVPRLSRTRSGTHRLRQGAAGPLQGAPLGTLRGHAPAPQRPRQDRPQASAGPARLIRGCGKSARPRQWLTRRVRQRSFPQSSPCEPPMLSALVSAIVRACSRTAWPVVLLGLLLGVAGAVYTVRHFQIDTNSENLLSAKAAWRQNELRYDQAFPQQNNTIEIVIDGVSAERAEQAAGALAAVLAKDRVHFTSVRRPDGGAFFEHEGLLLLPIDQVKKTTEALIQAQPFLGGLAADQSLRGIMKTLDTTLLGVTS